MDDDDIRTLVARLARPHPSGGAVVERVAIRAEGHDFAEVMRWIESHGGKPEEMPAQKAKGARQGLHGARFSDQSGAHAEAPRRFVLPPGVL